MSDARLEGRVAIVTGAGKGLGRSYALEMATRGAAVVVNDVDRESATIVVEEVERLGGRAALSTATVATPEGGGEITDLALDVFGGVDILVNNAGVVRPAYFEDLTLDRLEAVLDTHLRAAFYVTQPAWRVMKARRYGRIVMTSSASGMFGHQATANYAAAKAGIYGLTKALAFEGLDVGITVNAVLPVADTTITRDDPVPDLARHKQHLLSAAGAAALAARRGCEWVAPLVVHLASEACTSTGEAFSACAGRFARVLVGVSEGWLASGPDAPTAEEIAAHWSEIRDSSRSSLPMWLYDEQREVADRLLGG